MGNFIFLKSHWEDLSNTGELAENYVFSDPNTSMIKQGMFAERLVQYMLAYKSRVMIILIPTELSYLKRMICCLEI